MRPQGVTGGRHTRRSVRAAAIMLVAAVLLSCAGCSEESMQALGDAISDAYELYGPGHMHWSEDHMYYAWRQEMYAGNFKGEAYIELNDGRSLFVRGEESGWPDGVSYEHGSGTYQVYGIAVLTDPVPDGGLIIDPKGWSDVSYPGAVDGGYLWHGYSMMPERFGGEYCAENLKCCTAYAWISSIRAFEREVLDYLERDPENNRVLYRVTAVSQGIDYIPQGFVLEARALDRSGLDICRYAYNVQPGIGIDYSTGASWMDAAGKPKEEEPESAGTECDGSGQGGGVQP